MKSPVHLLAASLVCFSSLVSASGIEGADTADTWPRWGGPDGDFRVSTVLSPEWPKKGPELRWKAEALGGHSAPVVDEQRVYVISGLGKVHRVTAHDRASGRVLWTQESTARYASHRPDWDGPHTTPALVGDLLIVIQIDGMVRAHNRNDGAVRWQLDLLTKHGVDLPQSGWAASPLPFGDLVLLPGLGGNAPGALALRISDGSSAWTTGSFRSSHASPVLIEPNGEPLAIFHGMDQLVGIDPANGTIRWSRPLRNGAADNVSFTPLWDPTRRLLLISHRYDDVGTQAFHFPAGEDTPEKAPRWTQRRLQVEHGNAVLQGDQFIAAHRGAPGLFVGLDLDTGALQWRARLPKATVIVAGSQLIVFDETGRVHLAAAKKSKLERLSSFQAFDEQTWTIPTLAGRDLFVRSGSSVAAYRLP